MQLLETSMLGLRAARLVFRKSGASVAVTLFPVVHVGDSSFYQATYEDALAHDVVLFEGVRSPVTRRVTRSYRWLNLEKLGLVHQPRLRDSENRAARLVHADLSTAEFHACWRRLPIWLKLTVSVLAPIIGLYGRMFAGRESLVQNMSLEDRRSSRELLGWSPTVALLRGVILEAHDERLVAVLGQELERRWAGPARLAVVYGAQHMRAVRTELSRRGYICVDSDWRTVIAL